ncbi:MAG TPA: protein kinase [Burkholderiales bacterium]|nr:protein kinase [Burkholderiales bacterium]
MTGPQSIGKYEIQGEVGRGGMGVVYKAYDRAIARSVAIKCITKAALEPDDLKYVMGRFRHEAQAVGRLTHPRIVQIFDYGEDDQIAYIVMELVNGKTLQQHLQQGDTYELRESGEIIRQLLDGMGHAHAAGVVHRDIKPSNILINNDGRIKISDFGIARTEASGLTQAGDVLGTLHYMAPEQFLGGETDALADLFSIGVIAYELLAGRKPFMGSNVQAMQQVLNQQPEKPSRWNSSLSPLVDRVLQRALAKKREERFQNAREFADAFKEAIEASIASAGSAPKAAPDGAALMNAARLLNAAPPVFTAPAVASRDVTDITGDSAISLDGSIRKARVLFIDDEERILTALKSLFRDRYHVFTTTDGNKALDFMRKHQMHVIVSDQRMPAMLGVDLLRQSREISPRSVRILLTGYSDLAAIVGSINDGEVYRFISKPWDNNELQTIVAEAVTIALELADNTTAAAELPAKMEAGVLVLDKDEELYRVVRELAGDLCPVAYAKDIDSALAVMQKSEIAVVITDVEYGQERLTAMLKLLKQENPQILAIVVTGASDSELVIELINQAQIFRFLNKPVNVRLMRGHLHAALQRYLTYAQAPKLLSAHKVEVKSAVRESSFARQILDGFRAIRGRWFGQG